MKIMKLYVEMKIFAMMLILKKKIIEIVYHLLLVIKKKTILIKKSLRKEKNLDFVNIAYIK